MKPTICKNCLHTFEKNFCNNCGQRAIENRRISSREALKDFINTTFLFDRKLLFTFKGLFLNPGEVGRTYIEGQRQKFTKPTRFLIIIVAIFAVLNWTFGASDIVDNFTTIDIPFLSNEISHSFSVWSFRMDANHLLLTSCIQVLLVTVLLMLIFSKYEYSYIELLSINFFYVGTATLLLILLLAFFKIFLSFYANLNVVILVFLTYMCWAYYSFFNKESIQLIFFKILLFGFCFVSTRVGVTILISIFFPIPLDITH